MPKSGGYRKHVNVLRAGTGSEIMSRLSYQGTERKRGKCVRGIREGPPSLALSLLLGRTLSVETEPTADTQSHSQGEELSESQL